MAFYDCVRTLIISSKFSVEQEGGLYISTIIKEGSWSLTINNSQVELE